MAVMRPDGEHPPAYYLPRPRLALAFGLLLTCAGSGPPGQLRAATIDVGSHILLPNTAGQEVKIGVRGDELVAGVNLYAQVGDGGPELSQYGLPPGLDGPAITNVDLLTDTIFGSAIRQDVQPSVPQVVVASIEFVEPNRSTRADGMLATLTIDTRGFFAGQWPLWLDNVLPMHVNGPFATDFAGLPIGITNGLIQIAGPVRGDFDRDGDLDVADVDRLSEAIRNANGDPSFDLDGDGAVAFPDLRVLIEQELRTWFGDVNLDGEFGTSDLVLVFQAGEYEDSVVANSTWAEGDWNADLEVNSSDLVLAFQSSGFELGPRPAHAVPEPSVIRWLMVLLIMPAGRRRLLRCHPAGG